jgi:hypothetical protein
LTADTATYNVTGSDASLLRSLALTADQATFTITGNDVNLNLNKILLTDPAAYNLTGNDASFSLARRLEAALRTYSLNGNGADLLLSGGLRADTQSYNVTGNDATLSLNRKIIAVSEAYTVTTNDANITRTVIRTAAVASYTITTYSATIFYGNTLSAPAASYTVSTRPAVIRRLVTLRATSVNYVLNGNDASLTVTRIPPIIRDKTVKTPEEIRSINRQYLRNFYGWGVNDLTEPFDWTDSCGSNGANTIREAPCSSIGSAFGSSIYDGAAAGPGARWLTCSPECPPAAENPQALSLSPNLNAHGYHDIYVTKDESVHEPPVIQSPQEISRQPVVNIPEYVPDVPKHFAVPEPLSRSDKEAGYIEVIAPLPSPTHDIAPIVSNAQNITRPADETVITKLKSSAKNFDIGIRPRRRH